MTLRFGKLFLLLGLFLSAAASASAQVAVAAGPQSITGNYTIVFHVAYDSVNQVYLIVWDGSPAKGRFLNKQGAPIGDPFNIAVAGEPAGWTNVGFGGPPDKPRFIATYTLGNGTNNPRIARLITYKAAAAPDVSAAIKVADLFGEWNGSEIPRPVWTGQQFVISWRVGTGSGYPMGNTAVIGMDIDGNFTTGMQLLGDNLDHEVNPNVACNSTVCLAAGFAVGIPFGSIGGSWARLFDARTMAPLYSVFYLDNHSGMMEDQRVVYNPVTGLFQTAWVRQRANADFRLVNANGTLGPLDLSKSLGTGLGQLSMAYNATTRTTLLGLSWYDSDVRGLELGDNGYPLNLNNVPRLSDGAGDRASFSYYPSVAANETDGQWLAVYSGPYGGRSTLVQGTPQSTSSYALTANTTGSGTITVGGVACGTACTQTYPIGSVVTLTATPGAGYAFTGWTGDADCADGSVTMSAARACTATFQPSGPRTLYTLTVTTTGSGTVTVGGTACGTACAPTYDAGTNVSLVASPDAGYAFNGWTGNVDCADGVVTMDANKGCTATFVASAGLPQPHIAIATGPQSITGNYTIVFHLAYDSVNQVYLAVWDGSPAKGRFLNKQGAPLGDAFNIAAVGDPAGWTNVGFGGPPDKPRFICTYTLGNGTNNPRIARLITYHAGAAPDVSDAIKVADLFGEWNGSEIPRPVWTGQQFVISWRVGTGSGYPMGNTAVIGMDIDGNFTTGMQLLGDNLDHEVNPNVACNSGVCLAAGFAVGIPFGSIGGSWARLFDARTMAPLYSVFYLDNHSGMMEDQRVVYNPVTAKFQTAWVRQRAYADFRLVGPDGMLGPLDLSKSLGTGLGQLSMAYNAATRTTLLGLSWYDADVRGVELGDNGYPLNLNNVPRLSDGAGDRASFSYYPNVAANETDGQWLVIYSGPYGGRTTLVQGTPVATTSYTLTVTTAGSGTVTAGSVACGTGCTPAFAAGTVVTLTATPATGYTFTGWTGDADCADGSVTMSAARACTATFQPSGSTSYTLTVTTTGSGTVTVGGTSCGTGCAPTYTSGTVVALVATPATGYTFSGWTGDADCTDGSVTMNANKACAATFTSTVGQPRVGVIAGPVDITSVCNTMFHVAYDSVNQVYLVVWDGSPAKGRFLTKLGAPIGDPFNIAVPGEPAGWTNVGFGGPTDTPRFVVTYTIGNGTTNPKMARIVTYKAGAAPDVSAAIKLVDLYTAWSGSETPRPTWTGQQFVLSWTVAASGSSTANTAVIGMDVNGTLTTGVQLLGDNLDHEVNATFACGSDTCLATGFAVGLPFGSTGGSWARLFDARTLAPLHSLFYLDDHSGLMENQRAMFNPVTGQFETTWARQRNYADFRVVNPDGTRGALDLTKSLGPSSIGELTAAYNAGTRTSLLALAWTGNDVFGMELGDNSYPVNLSNAPRLSDGAGDRTVLPYPDAAANAADAQWLVVYAGPHGGRAVVVQGAAVQPITYTLTITTSGSGTVTAAGAACGTGCAPTFAAGTSVTLTATPGAGYSFTGWTGDTDCTDGQVTMSAAKACTAVFQVTPPTTYTLTVTTTGSGTVTVGGTSCGTGCAPTYNGGTVVALVATPATGYTFSGWTGDTDCADGSVTMNSSKGCSALFVPTSGQPPSHVTVAGGPTDVTSGYTTMFHVAYDSVDQVYLVVWDGNPAKGRFLTKLGVPIGDPFNIAVAGEPAGWTNVGFGGPADKPRFAVTYTIGNGTNNPKMVRLITYKAGAAPDVSAAIKVVDLNGGWSGSEIPRPTWTGQQFVLSWTVPAGASSTANTAVIGMDVNGAFTTGVQLLGDNLDHEVNATFACSADTCLATGFAVGMPFGSKGGSWARLFDARTLAPLYSLFYVDDHSGLMENQRAVFNSVTGQFETTWVRGRAYVDFRLVNTDGTKGPLDLTKSLGPASLGELTAAYNLGTRTTLLGLAWTNNDVFGLELGANGLPADLTNVPRLSDGGADRTVFAYPDAAANEADAQWLVIYAGPRGARAVVVQGIAVQPTSYPLTITTSGSGTVVAGGAACGTGCTQTYPVGTQVTLTPTAGAGYSFVGWTGDADCADGAVTMSASRACTAVFQVAAPTTYTLTVTTSGTGSVTVGGVACGTGCAPTFSPGTQVALTVTPGTGYTFVGWTGDADCVDGTVTMNASKACGATFQATSGLLQAHIDTVNGPTDRTAGYTTMFHLAYDSVDQVYLAVWDGNPAKGRFLDKQGVPIGDPFNIAVAGEPAAWTNVGFGGPADKPRFVVTYTIGNGTTNPKMVRLVTYKAGAAPDVSAAIKVVDLYASWSGSEIPRPVWTGQLFVLSWSIAAGGSAMANTAVIGMDIDGNFTTGVQLLGDNLDHEVNATFACSPDVCLATGFAVGIPFGSKGGSWARLFDARTLAPLYSVLYLDDHSGLMENQRVVFNPVTGQFATTWVRQRAYADFRLVNTDGTKGPLDLTKSLGPSPLGQLTVAYNAKARATLLVLAGSNNDVFGLALGDNGYPVDLTNVPRLSDGGADRTVFVYPDAAGNDADGQWLVIYSGPRGARTTLVQGTAPGSGPQ